jgi:signal recognition particle subunit SRP68
VWEDQPVGVRQPELVDVLFRVQEAEARLDHRGESETIKSGAGSKKSVAAFDPFLLALR